MHQLARQFVGSLHQAFRLDNFIDQTKAMSVVCVEHAAAQQKIARDLVADLPDQHGGHNGGHKSDAHLGVAKLGVRARRE